MHSVGRKGAKFLTLLVQDCSIISLTLECQGCIHCIFLWYISQVELPYKRQDCALRNIWKGTWHIIFLRKDYDFLAEVRQQGPTVAVPSIENFENMSKDGVVKVCGPAFIGNCYLLLYCRPN